MRVASSPQARAQAFYKQPGYVKDSIDNLIEGNGHVLLEGAAGTGKTERHAQFFEVEQARNPKSAHLFATLTHGTRATFDERVGAEVAQTFHSLGSQALQTISDMPMKQGMSDYLRERIPVHFSSKNIISPLQYGILVGNTLEQLGQNDPGYDYSDLEKYASAIEAYKGELLTENDFDTPAFSDFIQRKKLNPERFKTVMAESEKALRQIPIFDPETGDQVSAGAVTMGDLIRLPVLATSELGAGSEQEIWGKYASLQFDEMQQASPAINQMARDIIQANPRARTMMTADPQQSIFGFLGAKPEFLNRFSQLLQAPWQRLTKNFRNRGPVVAAAQKLMGLDDNWQTATLGGRGPLKMRGILAANQKDEASAIASAVEGMIGGGKDPNGILVQARTRAELVSIGKALNDKNIPYSLRHNEYGIAKAVMAGEISMEDATALLDQASESEDAISLSTIHSAQGTSASEAVILAGMSDNAWIHSGASREEIDESRRAMYTAVTRAKGDAEMLVTANMESGSTASRFLNEMGASVDWEQTPDAAARIHGAQNAAQTLLNQNNGRQRVNVTPRTRPRSRPQANAQSPQPRPAAQQQPQQTQPPAPQASPVDYEEALGNAFRNSQDWVFGRSSSYGWAWPNAQGDIEFVKDGNVTIDAQQVREGTSVARSVKTKVMGQAGKLVGAPEDVAATVRGLVYEIFDDEIQAVRKAAEQTKGKTGARAHAEKVRTVADEILSNFQDQVDSELGTSGSRGRYHQAKRTPIYTLQELGELALKDPSIAAKIQAAGGGEQFFGGGMPPTVFSGDNGDQYLVGDGDSSGSPYRSRQRMWGGKFGQFLYSAYIAKRLWTMTAAPVMQEVDQYGKYLGELAPMAAVSETQQGGQLDLNQTDAGYLNRQAATQRYFARGSFQQFGGFSDVAYSLTGSGDGLARAWAGLRVGGGIAALSAVAPAMLGSHRARGGTDCSRHRGRPHRHRRRGGNRPRHAGDGSL